VVDLHASDREAPASTVDDGDFRRGVVEDCRLFQYFSQRMSDRLSMTVVSTILRFTLEALINNVTLI